MAITTQYRVFGGIDVLDDQRPGTIDVRWAEDALSHGRPINRTHAVPRPPHRPPRQALRRLLAGLVIAACVVVAIVIAPGSSAPAPRRTPVPTTSTSRPPIVTSTNSKSFGLSGLLECPLGQPTSQHTLERLALPRDPSCFGNPVSAERGSGTRSQAG